MTLAAPLRTVAIGVASGVLSSAVLWPALGPWWSTALAAGAGGLWSLAFQAPRTALDAAVAGAAFGIPLWAGASAVLLPALAGTGPSWTAPAMRALLPALVAWVLFGAALGALSRALSRLAARASPPSPRLKQPQPRRVVIVGGGFAGVACARELERLVGADRSVAMTLVSETNALLFTPMLAEVAGSSLEPTHISAPIRTALRRTEVLRARVEGIDLERRCVAIAGERDAPPRTLSFDQLVIAAGAVTNYFGSASLERHAIGFKSLREAIRIRNQVIDAFERSGREDAAARRRELLTFVVAGGGFAGAELAGALNDFARGILADYPALGPEDVRVILVHAGEAILPELSPALARYAQERMAARGVEFRLRARVKDAGPGVVVLESGETIRAGTLVWTAGARPHPMIAALPAARDRRGAIVVDGTLAVPGLDGVWAAGDCAAVPDARTGAPCPPTAQFALREGRQVARNVHAALHGRRPRAFRFASLGALCVVGHHTACAELTVPFARSRAIRFSGLLAWLLWRAIYLSKLPGSERKVRVCADWLIELFFPRDIVQTLELGDVSPLLADAEVKHAS